ncbi:MAG: NUDIX domain-containing protein [Bacteroidia bacterium]|nr:NUDIX domain-containing protein [Bacteroidia bacterium]
MVDRVRKYVESLEKEAIPQLSVNCVIFGFHERTLQVIVNKISVGQNELTLLPGGYVKQTEDLPDAVERIVKESTGLTNILFKQFAVFGKASRSFGKSLTDSHVLNPGLDQSIVEWLSKRFVSICYLALVDYSKIELKPTQFLEAAHWMPTKEGKKLDMDHADILESARASLLKEMPYTPIASNLLPARFTLPELQALVEFILGRSIDRPNFRRKILSTGMIVKVGAENSGKRRPADLYKFKHGKKTSLIDEFKLGF